MKKDSMVPHRKLLTQGLGSIPVRRVVADTLANGGRLITQGLDIIKSPRGKGFNSNLQRIMFKGNVTRNTRVAVNTINEVGLLSRKVIHLPIVSINIPDDD